ALPCSDDDDSLACEASHGSSLVTVGDLLWRQLRENRRFAVKRTDSGGDYDASASQRSSVFETHLKHPVLAANAADGTGVQIGAELMAEPAAVFHEGFQRYWRCSLG